ncbi:sulfotransferase [Sulfitobacter sp. LCG007]
MNQQTPPARILLGQADRLRRQGDAAAAADLYGQIISRFPGNARARAGLALIENDEIRSVPQGRLDAVATAFAEGRLEEALQMAEALAGGGQLHPALIDVMGACHLRLGRPEAAVQVYERALPAHETAALWSAKAQALHAAGRPGRAAAGFARAAALEPGTAVHWINLAACLLETGEPEQALDALQRALAIAPADPNALTLRGRIALNLGDADGAQQAFAAALEADPANTRTRNELAILARALGRRDEAIAQYEAALERYPDSPVLHRNLSEIAEFDGPGDPRIARMETLLARGDLSGPDRAQLGFALFNAWDQVGDTARAFDFLRDANALRRAELGYDVSRDAALFQWLKTLGIPCAPMGEPAVRPVFVTGLPRSGTTLTEHMLSHGADVRPAGELSLVKSAVAPILRSLRDGGRQGLGLDEVLDLQRILRNRLAEYAAGHAFIVDKMPLNFRWIGFLRAALPEARIVVMDRDPMALGWSLYRQCFGGAGNGFAYDLDDIACFQALARDLVAHFRTQDPERIVMADFAALTADPMTAGLALRRACGIPDPDETLGVPDITRPILTASADQVRKAVDPGRDNGWRRYASQLAPLRAALDQLGAAGL